MSVKIVEEGRRGSIREDPHECYVVLCFRPLRGRLIREGLVLGSIN